MRKQGTVQRFDAERGFGFIRSAQTTADVFFHIKDYRSQQVLTPRIGAEVSFDEIHVGGKGPRAMGVRPVAEDAGQGTTRTPPRRPRGSSQRRVNSPPSSGTWFILPLALLYVTAIGWAVWTRMLPFWFAPALLALNLATFMAYWHDKYRAEQDQWRIAETHLHLWSFAGGWIGAWLAQQVLRHKTRKQSFRDVYWFSVVMHCAAVFGWLWIASNGFTAAFS